MRTPVHYGNTTLSADYFALRWYLYDNLALPRITSHYLGSVGAVSKQASAVSLACTKLPLIYGRVAVHLENHYQHTTHTAAQGRSISLIPHRSDWEGAACA